MSEDSKPPFVIFEVRAVEDRQGSIDSGHYVAKDVVFAIITPAGTKDRIEKVAEDWLRDLVEAVNQERFPRQWLDAYKQAHKAFLNNQEIPENGTPVKDWPGASPAQIRNLLDIGLRTVEQVAEATEEAISRIGMGGRALKSRAQAYLDASKGDGKISAELDDLRQKVEALTNRDTEREAALQNLQAENEALRKAAEVSAKAK